MAPKAKIPAPIDRPLSRAYLREFTGWSTAYPPGLSDPTSLRKMENVQVNRDGSVRIRPGLRYLSWESVPSEGVEGTPASLPTVGTHEVFFLNDGTKAYLFAVRELDDTIGFRVLVLASDGAVIRSLTDPGVDFTIAQGEEVLNFSAQTTYVKYLQIDNKIFALSNAGESMRMFFVGENKSAKKLSSLERPDWSVADKLTVMHPDGDWIVAGGPVSVRTNLLPNPSFTTSLAFWSEGERTELSRTATSLYGSHGAQVESRPTRTNLMTRPLYNPANGTYGWSGEGSISTVEIDGTYLKATAPAGTAGRIGYLYGPRFGGLKAGRRYVVAADWGVASAGVITESLLVRFYNSSGVQVGANLNYTRTDLVSVAGRQVTDSFAVPAGATRMQVVPNIKVGTDAAAALRIKNLLVCEAGEDTTMFTGASGPEYYWEGAANNSASVYHPATTCQVIADSVPVSAGLDYYFNIAGIKPGTSGSSRSLRLQIQWLDAALSVIGTSASLPILDDGAPDWVGAHLQAAAPAGAVQAIPIFEIFDVPRGEEHVFDGGLFEQSSTVGLYFDGDTPSSSAIRYEWTGPRGASTSTCTTYATGQTIPTAEAPTAETLVSSTAADNVYNYGFFYTLANEIGESAASQVTVIRAQRPWSGLFWETPNATGEPSGTPTEDPTAAADQLVAILPEEVFSAAIDQGATRWNLYMLTWSNQDPVPVEAVRIAERPLGAEAMYGSVGWARATPQMADASAVMAPLPNSTTRHNYSNPSRGGQGLVAADRLVMVYDPTAAAVIRWSSNQQGSYTDFTASKGGGYKTLTSGNIFVPACVKLWQNPQSVDTLTILCLGVDGHSTGYYMAPAQVASQSDATNVMGFEETTATPGTSSPYGCEVLNNALYHPLDTELMKSTASNYNINHKPMSDPVANLWTALLDKQMIISSQCDNRLYYIVHNPQGEKLQEGCHGNEIWVFDAAAKNGTWSRFLIQAHSLRKIEQGGRIYMSVVRPDGMYYLDPSYDRDDTVDAVNHRVVTRFIPWSLETNTQGANRAHDAWCHLQQANIVVGNFLGQMRYGIRGHDINGRPVEISKILRDAGEDELGVQAWDLEDYLLIRRDLKEWFFFAESVPDEDGEPERSVGQIGLVQYRYTPSTVNTGYEYGSVETFEYGRAGNLVDARTTDNGVPMPYVDTGRP